MDTIFLEGTLELFASLLIIFTCVHFGSETIKKHKHLAYLMSGLLSGISLLLGVLVFVEILEVPLSLWWVRCIRSIVSGYLPAVVFMAVMYAGVLPSRNYLKSRLMTIRTELSIIGTILYLPHTLIYSIFSAPHGIMDLINGEFHLAYQLMTWTGLVNALLLIILGTTSIPQIRKKFTPSTWKKIQKTSYLFYFNCFVHYMTLSIWSEAYERALVYMLIYGFYVYLFIVRAQGRRSINVTEQTT